MKRIIYILFIFLFSQAIIAQELPEKNKTIITFVESNKGKKVGKGECWDLAKVALDTAGATWTPPYEFGKEVSTKKETVLPGDIIQFEKVRIVYPDKSGTEIPHHTAIIYKVISPGKYMIAEQNSDSKRYVTFSEIDLNYIQKGKYAIFRPQP